MVGGSCQNPAMSQPMRRVSPISGVVMFANVEQESRLNILTAIHISRDICFIQLGGALSGKLNASSKRILGTHIEV